MKVTRQTRKQYKHNCKQVIKYRSQWQSIVFTAMDRTELIKPKSLFK